MTYINMENACVNFWVTIPDPLPLRWFKPFLKLIVCLLSSFKLLFFMKFMFFWIHNIQILRNPFEICLFKTNSLLQNYYFNSVKIALLSEILIPRYEEKHLINLKEIIFTLLKQTVDQGFIVKVGLPNVSHYYNGLMYIKVPNDRF